MKNLAVLVCLFAFAVVAHALKPPLPRLFMALKEINRVRPRFPEND
jgi:hypothetical protein